MTGASTVVVSLTVALTLVSAVALALQPGVPEPTLQEPADRRPDGPRPDSRAEAGAPTDSGFLAGIPVPEMAECDQLVADFMDLYSIPSVTFALAKDGKLVYMRAFGFADLAGSEPTQPYHMFRIASISKTVTAVAIMQMVERGQLDLDDLVFGPGGLLENHPYLSAATISDTRIYDIRVRHLLEHSAGWDRSVNCFPNPTSPYPWFFSGCDPIAAPLHVTEVLGAPNPASAQAFIRFLLEKGLDFAPGTGFGYSNIGYSVLGEIIEMVSGKDYEEYVKAEVLSPLGICEMHLGLSLLEDKREREGEYVGNGNTTKSCFGTGEDVPWTYGGFAMEGMGSHGAWIATARALTRLLVAVDGFATKPDMLDAATITTMTTATGPNPSYALGWMVNTFDNWWHTGALDGTASFFARISNGYTWAVILNKRVVGGLAQAFWSDLDDLPFNCIAATSSFPTHDLMEMPSANASNLSFTAVTESTVTVSWDNGNGDQRILVASQGSEVLAFPLDGVSYSADSVFGSGDDLGGGCFVVYSGTGATATISGLDPDEPYSLRVFEFNQNPVTGDYPLYMLCNSASDQVCTTRDWTRTSLMAVKSATPGSVTFTWTATASGTYNLHRTDDKTSIPSLWSDMSTMAGASSTTSVDDNPPDAPIHYYQVYPDCLGESAPW